jgi:hypothetical protein
MKNDFFTGLLGKNGEMNKMKVTRRKTKVNESGVLY